MNTDLRCRDERRRQMSRERNLNGVDYVEVGQDPTVLCVHLFGDVPANIDKASVRIKGGRRVRDIQVVSVSAEREDDPELGECLRVVVDKTGDFSIYELCIVEVENGKATDKPRKDFDPRYSCAEFSFKIDCATDLDCRQEQNCSTEAAPEPEINYLAKDYASFRQLMLDRLALVLPDWKERHVADLGVTLVELLAYFGDYLSYYQDAVATEAYLDTARQRISVRRHALFVDYRMHEGCNARAWVSVETDDDHTLDPNEFLFVTGGDELERAGASTLNEQAFIRLNLSASNYEVFEPIAGKPVIDLGEIKSADELTDRLRRSEDEFSKRLHAPLSSNTQHLLAGWDRSGEVPEALRAALTDEWRQLRETDIDLYQFHSTIRFYTWQDAECCLPQGATRATLIDEWKAAATPAGNDDNQQGYKANARTYGKETAPPHAPTERQRKLRLRVGDVLIVEEIKGGRTGVPADADFAHRHAVRLTRVEPAVDPLSDQPVVEVAWGEDDALPFPLCISAVLPAPDCRLVEDISVARGNVILVDHGKTIESPEPLGQVPVETVTGECECGSTEMIKTPGDFQPLLKHAPLTFRQPPDASLSASAMLVQDPRQAFPQIKSLISRPGVCSESGEIDGSPRQVTGGAEDHSDWQWQPRSDLLSSRQDDRHFVPEMDDEGRAHLRFGDGELGRKPEACSVFEATYRVGNGEAGNVGADTIRHLVFRQTRSGVNLRPRNPLPATGGAAPEPMSNVKLFAPGAIRKDLQRAITAGDYSRLTERNKKVQRASAELRWTGSWHEVRVAVDPRGSEVLDERLHSEIAGHLYPYRRIGHDLAIGTARYVPLEIELTVCVLPHYQRGHVKAALLEAFGNRLLPGNRRGFFHPDNLTFGEGVYLSQLVAAAHSVQGVASVTVTKMNRRFAEPNKEIENGILPLGSMEVAQLDNDPSFPEHGKITLVVNGGR